MTSAQWATGGQKSSFFTFPFQLFCIIFQNYIENVTQNSFWFGDRLKFKLSGTILS